ncbi:glucosidase 2 subunit beta isoform X2 [Silurus meridionalis]|uniref:glucosidase 2 subunit beta isoform X2 n=1 Tax=Silurus meridionalis TaxID=175797 RepID=UPI001EEA55F3|nr:glucosidase 2 subunit beta isoform X2 [Silurus meridionalis]
MSSTHLLLMVSLGLAVGSAAAVEVQKPRGVPLSRRHFYDEKIPFTCLDGSRTIPFDRVNDDYCDCKDGSDEPGTSACPNGVFHCTNAGFRPTSIPSSRINDGICDCCDTTDEYNSGAKCENTCREMGRTEREVLQKMAEITKEGFLLKQQLIQETKKTHQEKQKKLTDLQTNKKEVEEKVEAIRTIKETAEQPEKEAKERHLKAWEEQKAVIRMEKDKAKMAEAFLELDDDADGFVSVAELQTHAELDTDADGTFSETEAQGLLGGVQAGTAAFESVWNNIKEKYVSESQPKEPTPVDTPAEESKEPVVDNDPEPYPEDDDIPEDEDEDVGDDDDDDDDYPEEDLDKSPPSVKTPEKTEDEDTMPPYDSNTQALIDAAQKAREEFDESEKALREVEDQIRNIEKELSFDFGPSNEFAYLYNQCYELSTSEYIYRLCPFNRVSQKPKYGGSETNLGTWGTWAGSEDNKYLVMKYEHGTGCWQGPNRSTTVKMTCGKETTVTATSEPSRCEYLMEFITPAVCQEPSLVDPTLPEHDEF